MAKKKQGKKSGKGWRKWRALGSSRPVVWVAGAWRGVKERGAKNPHRSFRRTDKWAKKRRELKLPGYFAFFGETRREIWKARKAFGWLLLVIGLTQIIFVGLLSTETITAFQSALQTTGGDMAAVTAAGLTLMRTISTGGIDDTMNENGAAIRILTIVLIWLATVVIMRQLLAGNKIKMRDALYTCGAPITASVGVLLIMVFQAIPILVSVLLYNAAVATEFLRSPMTGIAFFVFVGCLVLLSVYWLIQSILALIVVTLPGTYPVKALHIAGDLIRGRRVRLILRVAFMFFILSVLITIIMIPLIMLFSWLGGIASWVNAIPILPVILVFITCGTVIFSAAYVYLLYRKMLDSERHVKQ
ncbi:hypothetical protein FWH09_03105 [Candidatus Saccharibacteria bacterium]|nr:hypothetical protein [Candidatus Saccharibacteria bacterium]